jgi:hypothetical protein
MHQRSGQEKIGIGATPTRTNQIGNNEKKKGGKEERLIYTKK